MVFTCFFVIYLLFNILLMFIKEDLNTSKVGLKAIKKGLTDFNSLNK